PRRTRSAAALAGALARVDALPDRSGRGRVRGSGLGQGAARLAQEPRQGDRVRQRRGSGEPRRDAGVPVGARRGGGLVSETPETTAVKAEDTAWQAIQTAFAVPAGKLLHGQVAVVTGGAQGIGWA